MENPVHRPNIINALGFGTDAAMAMLAGIQIDMFIPLQNGPLTVEQIDDAIGGGSARLRFLLYVLVAASLLTEQNRQFSNTPKAKIIL